ncbi:MAG: exonuclease domain-containing protein [Rubripirellula sp.]
MPPRWNNTKGVPIVNQMTAVDVMDFAADFTAIDFETANRRPESACQLGAVVVRKGKIIDEAAWMIRPEPLYFSRGNIRIHGITPDRVRDEPTLGELWPEIAERLGDDCLVAHNASFDIGVLLASLRAHRQTIPEIQFTCTRAVARRTWPHHRRYGLKPLSNWLGIRFRHHDALEDSIACAKILLAAGIDREAESLPDLEKRLRLSRGKAGPWGHRGPAGRSSRARSTTKNVTRERSSTQTTLPFLFPDQVASSKAEYQTTETHPPTIDLQRLFIRADFIRPLNGKQIVFAGRLTRLTRHDAESLATRLGGTCQTEVDDSTDYLIVGSTCKETTATDLRREQSRAEELNDSGKAIRIVDENEFLGLVITPTADS